jgi:hypothetical protein
LSETEREEFAEWLTSPHRLVLAANVATFAVTSRSKWNPCRERPQHNAPACALVVDLLKYPRLEAYTLTTLWDGDKMRGVGVRDGRDMIRGRALFVLGMLREASKRRRGVMGGELLSYILNRPRPPRDAKYLLRPTIHHLAPAALFRTCIQSALGELRAYYPEPALPALHFALTLPTLLPVPLDSPYLGLVRAARDSWKETTPR